VEREDNPFPFGSSALRGHDCEHEAVTLRPAFTDSLPFRGGILIYLQIKVQKSYIIYRHPEWFTLAILESFLKYFQRGFLK